MPGNWSFSATTLAAVLSLWTPLWAIDTDQDGVDDEVDVCCNSPLGIIVDEKGRPTGDLDGDCDVDLGDYEILHIELVGVGPGPAGLRTFASFQSSFTDELVADGPCCAAPLGPIDDGTELPPGGIPDMIISEIKPQEYIEVFNATVSDIDLSVVGWQWCAPFQYTPVATPVTVPAGGYVTLDWPALFFTNPTESDGEVILYKDFFFSSNSSLLDFVCWGSPSPSRRTTQGAGSGKWSGLCAPSIPSGGAIHRKIGTDGTSADSYDVTAPPSAMTCIP